jgi:hypothetical protein
MDSNNTRRILNNFIKIGLLKTQKRSFTIKKTLLDKFSVIMKNELNKLP